MVVAAGAGRRGPRWDVAERTAFLATVRVFAPLPVPVLTRLAARFSPRQVAPGMFVFREGEPASTIYVLAAGRLKVVRETEDGREVILRLVRPGQLVDGAGGWGEAVYPASAIAQAAGTVLAMPAREFAAILDRHPGMAVGVVRELAARLRDAEGRIRDLQTERAERRLAHALLRLAQTTGIPSTTGVKIGVPLSRQDLAELAGTTMSTASRTVSAWEHRGIVTVGRERVTICDLPALRAIADGSAPPPAP